MSNDTQVAEAKGYLEGLEHGRLETAPWVTLVGFSVGLLGGFVTGLIFIIPMVWP